MKTLAIFFTFIFFLLIYARYIEPNHIVIKSVEIRSYAFADILSDKTVLHLSDLHFSDGRNPLLNQILQKVKQLKPDLIFLTGDYVEWFSGAGAYRQALYFLDRLPATYGVFAVMGDADYTSSRHSCNFCHRKSCEHIPAQNNVRFLRNELLRIPIDQKFLNVAGVDTTLSFYPRSEEINKLVGNEGTIFLTHTSLPYAALAPDKPVVVLCGDTHGGQVYLPLSLWERVKRKPDPAHMHGFFQDNNKFLVVSNGLGTSQLDLRLAMPPQIIILKFLPEEIER